MSFFDYNLDNFLQDVYEFNEIAGNQSTSKEAFLAQHRVLQEEVDEVKEAIDNNDLENLAKEVTDVLYVAGGLVQKLEALGVDMSSVLSEVAYNNLTKFPKNKDVIGLSQADYSSKGVETIVYFNDEYQTYLLKDLNGKVRKPISYKNVNISAFIPKSNIY